MNRIVLATALALRERDGVAQVLLVASRYANQPQPLWNLPGGRQQPGELLEAAAVRECLEETGVHVGSGSLAYVSESFDGDQTHVVNVTFHVEALDDAPPALPSERGARDHVVAAQWVPVSDVAAHVRVAVVRDPLVAYLAGTLSRRYAGFPHAGITIEWPADSQ